jgi:hypothetical protein
MVIETQDSNVQCLGNLGRDRRSMNYWKRALGDTVDALRRQMESMPAFHSFTATMMNPERFLRAIVTRRGHTSGPTEPCGTSRERHERTSFVTG